MRAANPKQGRPKTSCHEQGVQSTVWRAFRHEGLQTGWFHSYTVHDFICQLHWVPVATDQIVRLSRKVDRGLNKDMYHSVYFFFSIFLSFLFLKKKKKKFTPWRRYADWGHAERPGRSKWNISFSCQFILCLLLLLLLLFFHQQWRSFWAFHFNTCLSAYVFIVVSVRKRCFRELWERVLEIRPTVTSTFSTLITYLTLEL